LIPCVGLALTLSARWLCRSLVQGQLVSPGQDLERGLVHGLFRRCIPLSRFQFFFGLRKLVLALEFVSIAGGLLPAARSEPGHAVTVWARCVKADGDACSGSLLGAGIELVYVGLCLCLIWFWVHVGHGPQPWWAEGHVAAVRVRRLAAHGYA
jgi:hypothetical protein